MNRKGTVNLNGRELVIVAGSSGNIGSEVCRVLNSDGCEVIGLDIKKPMTVSSDYMEFSVDVSKMVQLENMLGYIVDTYGPDSISGFVNCVDYEDHAYRWDETNTTAILGTMEQMLKCFMNPLSKYLDSIKYNGGSIVNISTLPGVQTIDQGFAHEMAHAAMNSLVKRLSAELVKDGVTINSITPNYIGASIPSEIYYMDKNAGGGVVPISYKVKAREIANMVSFLMNRKCNVTGINFESCGNWSMQK